MIDAPSMTTSAATVLAAVNGLADELRDRIAEFEGAKRVPADIHDRLREAGFYRLLLPASHGGLEATSDEVLDVIEALARIDGSLAWATTIGIQSPAVFSWLSRSTFDQLHSENPDVTIGGAFGPQGRATVVDGGYLVDGRWGFASGCDNWDFLFANCIVVKDGEPVIGAGGRPSMRAMVLPKDAAEIIDTWKTLGMRGTGSQDFALAGVFVADEFTFDLGGAVPSVAGITRYPLIEFGYELATIAIGVAQGALDDVAASASARTRALARTSIADDPVAQHRIGRVATTLRAARALIREDAAALREVDDETDFMQLMTSAAASCAWVVDACIDVVETCFRTNGARGIFDDAPLQRRLRDILTLAQHATLNDSAWTRHGSGLLGSNEPPAQ
ncbi:hydroxylase [Salinibacterium hongtaonis]|uniref:Hydroxylase n=2 Tax=Homoserinimonas hongtaonis TaxID=2079791 RepID=A0A2U1T1N9_9MICO|nr:hydroxylase [Salinibacterium hongtaonis]